MDLKKQIKLSGLLRRPATAKKAGAAKARRGEVVGLKIGASQLAASRVANNGSARLLQLARGPLPSGIVVSGEVRDIPALAAALDEFFRTHKLPRRGVRLGVATNRIGVRSFELAGIDDELQLDERDPLPGTRRALDPGRRRGARLPRRLGDLDDSGQTVRAHRPRRRVPRLHRPLCRRLQAGRRRGRRRSTSRRSPCCAPSRPRSPATRRPPSSR